MDLKPCPFCGAKIEIKKCKYPNGEEYIYPDGRHDDECLLSMVSWDVCIEDGWTVKALARSWNRRNFDY